MGNLAHGWALVAGHGGVVIVFLLVALTFVAIGMSVAMAAARRRNQAKPGDTRLQPIPRTQIPGSVKDYRREQTGLD